ncbi:MAG: peptide MFS transporter [Caulobacteraceae bacterium]
MLLDLVTIVGIVVTVGTAIPVVMQLRQHPRGLGVLFFAEMWERFSYYGMRGLLIFYLTQQFLIDDTTAQQRYGAYTSLVYLTPLIGGFLADKYLGTRKAVLFGCLLLVAGHFTMAIEGAPATQVLSYKGASYQFVVEGRGADRQSRIEVEGRPYEYTASPDGALVIKGLPAASPLPATLPNGSFVLSVQQGPPMFEHILSLALGLIVMGVGFLKANISSIVGQLYPQGDPRRDPGFTLYYYGINLGAFWASIACGALGERIGWWAGFGAAGVGMLLGAIVFVWGKPLLEGHGEAPSPEALKKPLLGPINLEWVIYLAGIIGVGIAWVMVQNYAVVGWALAIASVVVIRYFFKHMADDLTVEERHRMWLALILVFGSVVFWTLFEQAGSSLNQFAERNTDLAIGFGQEMTAAQTQSFNAGFILLFAPAFSALWAWLGRRSMDPTSPNKFALALVQVGAGFLVLVWGAGFADASYKVPVIFLALAYLLHTTGELCLSPVGLSQMTKLSTPLFLSTVMAVWFLGSSWAQFLGAIIAGFTAQDTIAGQVVDPKGALETYVKVFQAIGVAAIVIGLGFWLLEPFLKKLSHGVDDLRGDTAKPEISGDRSSVDLDAI